MTASAPRLDELTHALARTHRARVRRRRAIAAAAVTLPALALSFALLPPSPRPRVEGVASSQREGGDSFTISQHAVPLPLPLGERMSASSPTGQGTPTSFITIIRDTPPVARMTDDELLEVLAEAGHPSGLMTINGKTTIVANTFSDDGTPSPLAPLFGVRR